MFGLVGLVGECFNVGGGADGDLLVGLGVAGLGVVRDLGVRVVSHV